METIWGWWSHYCKRIKRKKNEEEILFIYFIQYGVVRIDFISFLIPGPCHQDIPPPANGKATHIHPFYFHNLNRVKIRSLFIQQPHLFEQRNGDGKMNSLFVFLHGEEWNWAMAGVQGRVATSSHHRKKSVEETSFARETLLLFSLGATVNRTDGRRNEERQDSRRVKI